MVQLAAALFSPLIDRWTELRRVGCRVERGSRHHRRLLRSRVADARLPRREQSSFAQQRFLVPRTSNGRTANGRGWLLRLRHRSPPSHNAAAFPWRSVLLVPPPPLPLLRSPRTAYVMSVGPILNGWPTRHKPSIAGLWVGSGSSGWRRATKEACLATRPQAGKAFASVGVVPQRPHGNAVNQARTDHRHHIIHRGQPCLPSVGAAVPLVPSSA